MDSNTRRQRGGWLAAALLAGTLSVAGCQAGDSLAGPTWQWVASSATDPAGPAVVANPEDYTITFAPGGGVTVKADCHDLDGTFRVGIPVDLTITVGAAPTAGCTGDSLDTVYLDLLADVESFSTGGGILTLELVGDGVLQFRVAGA